MGAYRFWRDLGYALGALISGVVADLLGMRAAIQVMAALTLLSGLQVAFRMRETHFDVKQETFDVRGARVNSDSRKIDRKIKSLL